MSTVTELRPRVLAPGEMLAEAPLPEGSTLVPGERITWAQVVAALAKDK